MNLWLCYVTFCASLVQEVVASSAFYDIKLRDIKGVDIDMGLLRGKPVLVSNVATQCGYTESGYRYYLVIPSGSLTIPI